jgi:type IV secretion system protein VirB2
LDSRIGAAQETRPACVQVLTLSLAAPADSSLSDPPGPNVIVGPVVWLQGTILGTFTTIVAILAVASVGLKMLSARLSVRRGTTVVLGCSILF